MGDFLNNKTGLNIGSKKLEDQDHENFRRNVKQTQK